MPVELRAWHEIQVPMFTGKLKTTSSVVILGIFDRFPVNFPLFQIETMDKLKILIEMGFPCARIIYSNQGETMRWSTRTCTRTIVARNRLKLAKHMTKIG